MCFYRVCFASVYILSAILKIPMRVFLMPVRGAGYTINRVGFCLSINREKIRLFPSDFMRTYF